MSKTNGNVRNSNIASFIRDHGASALGYAMGLSRNRETAQDLFQDALCTVLSKGDYYDPARPLKPLLFKIIRNRFLDKKKRGRKSREYTETARWSHRAGIRQGAFCESRDDVVTGVLRLEAAKSVQEALAALRPQHREVLVFRDLEGRKYREVAAKLGVPIGTVRSRVHRARKALKRRLKSWEGA